MSGIFISYRRSTSQHFARLIFSELQQRGHDVFLDVNSIDAGAFDRIIKNQIAARPHFLLLLSKGSLERCVNAGDWLLQEIQEAVSLNRNVVPVYDEGFNFEAETKYLPEALQKFLRVQNAPPYSHYYFKAFIDALSDRFLKDSVNTIAVFPTPAAERAEVQKRIEQAAQPNDDWIPQIPEASTRQPVSPQTQIKLTDFMKMASQLKQESEMPKPAQPLVWGVENILRAPFEWVYIPPGPVTIEINKNIQTVSVTSFNIAKYPITRSQYNAFLSAEDGYRNPLWWDDRLDARTWRQKNPDIHFQNVIAGSDYPVSNVSWFEAVAFCKWLAYRFNSPSPELTPMTITLPTEAQWLRAARGDSSRIYPWGGKFDSSRCNTKDSNIGRTTPVTQYITGASPFGVMDMSGNVFEWFLESHTGEDVRGVRGGSWKTDQVRAQLYYREDVPISNRVDNIGFRIVMMNTN